MRRERAVRGGAPGGSGLDGAGPERDAVALTRRELLRAGGSALALAWLGLPGCQPTRRRLDSGPYVQRVTGTSALVCAVTEGLERLVVRWGPDGDGGTLASAEDPEPVQVHGLEVAPLLPGTLYRYWLENSAGHALGEATFRSARAPGGEFTFAALGDSGGTDDSHGRFVDELDQVNERLSGEVHDENQQHRVGAAMVGSQAELVLHAGDVVYPSGERQDYPDAYFRPFGGVIASRPVYPVLGNHDAKTEGGAPLLETFFLPDNGHARDGRSYSFDWGDAHFTALDVTTSPFDAASAQLAWAEEDLRRSDRRWRIVLFHVPPLSASRHGDAPDILESVVPALERAGADLALSGNDHVYSRFFPVGRVTYVTTGGGGKSLYPVLGHPRLAYGESVFHFVEVTVSPSRLALRAVDAEGRPFDETTIVGA